MSSPGEPDDLLVAALSHRPEVTEGRPSPVLVSRSLRGSDATNSPRRDGVESLPVKYPTTSIRTWAVPTAAGFEPSVSRSMATLPLAPGRRRERFATSPPSLKFTFDAFGRVLPDG